MESLVAVYRLLTILEDEADERYSLLGIIFGICLSAVLVGFGLNVAGIKGVNFIFAITIPFASLLLWLRPRYLAAVIVAGAGSVITNKEKSIEKATEGVKKFFKYYSRSLFYTAFWASNVFIFLATVPFDRHPAAFIVICAVLISVGLIAIKKNWEAKYLYRVVLTYSLAIFIITITWLIPSEMRIRIMGYDPWSFFASTETEEALAAIEKTMAKEKDESNAEKIKVLNKKIKAGEVLTSEDNEFLKGQKSQRDERSLPRKMSQTAGEIGEWWNKKPEDKPAAQSKEETKKPLTKIFTLNPYKVDSVDVQQGQGLRFTSFNNAFEFRVQKGDEDARWGTTEKNEIWHANYDGKLQVRAGDKQVSVTVEFM
jgi:hypothetical protein